MTRKKIHSLKPEKKKFLSMHLVFELLDEYRDFLDSELQFYCDAQEEKVAVLLQSYIDSLDLVLDELETQARYLGDG